MKKIKREEPIIPQQLETLAFLSALDDQYINNCKIALETIDFDPGEALHFDKVIFENVNFLEVVWPRSEFTDVIFLNCDLSNADFSRCVFHRTEFHNSKLVGTNLAEAGVRHTLFKDCLMNYATFGFSLCNTTRFESSSLRYADFYQAELKNTEFNGNEMEDINFAETSLKGVDLSTNSFSNIQVTIEKLKGCKVSPNQALAFARQLGLIVAED